jgi:hypothetical protein
VCYTIDTIKERRTQMIQAFTEEEARLDAINAMTDPEVIGVRIEYDADRYCWWTYREFKFYDEEGDN